jgi:hypothetical protein
MGLTTRYGSKLTDSRLIAQTPRVPYWEAGKIARRDLDYDIVLRRSALVINAPSSVRATAADWGCALG